MDLNYNSISGGMKQYMLIVFSLLLTGALCSCSKLFSSIPAGATEATFLPGECLKNFELQHLDYGFDTGSNDSIRMHFEYTPDVKKEILEKTPWGAAVKYRCVPSDAVWKESVQNKERVAAQYEKIWSDLDNNYMLANQLITVYLNGDIRFTCDHRFAGYWAGEDLSSLVRITSAPYRHPGAIPMPDDIDVNSQMIVPHFWINVGLEGHKLFSHNEKDVRYTFEIPVRIYRYLKWLEDIETDKDAPITYHDTVLTCTFLSSEILL